MILHFALDVAAGAAPVATAARAMIAATLASATATLATVLAALCRFSFIGFSKNPLSTTSAAAVVGAEGAATAASWRP